MAQEHLICEFCKAEFDSFDAYREHKLDQHPKAEAARDRQLDEGVRETLPASDVPAATNPTSGLGEPDEDEVRDDEPASLRPPAPPATADLRPL